MHVDFCVTQNSTTRTRQINILCFNFEARDGQFQCPMSLLVCRHAYFNYQCVHYALHNNKAHGEPRTCIKSLNLMP